MRRREEQRRVGSPASASASGGASSGSSVPRRDDAAADAPHLRREPSLRRGCGEGEGGRRDGLAAHARAKAKYAVSTGNAPQAAANQASEWKRPPKSSRL